ncbi:MAG: hypothetical protein A2284_05000 [Deltaproteobacteria bacterium RIFOXYA12_FULL_61_11]|nr:MAG: hypothetical protein A2284_05000 [Deltaproteobacteria bacterium RIFOXYA12_FULL_61_11]
MKHLAPGGGFLFSQRPDIFIREDLSEEQREFGATARRLFEEEIAPKIEQIEHKGIVEREGHTTPLAIDFLKKAGELGILMVDIDEEHGGLGLDKTTSMHMSEMFVGNASIATTIGAHIGIGTLPIVLFGNEEQKNTYLPKLVTAELVSCYALTEPGNGSDALSGKTTAVLQEDGHYLINGAKQFITNGAWADLAIVFAMVEGKYSAFIVDLHTKGVERGAEEKKMGLHGSSTTALVFDTVRVPKANLLGEIGDGPKIALNILNLGRLKLGFSSLGNAKKVLDMTIRYCLDRKQFGNYIINFEAQKNRLAEMTARIFAVDSFGYCASGLIDEAIARLKGGEDHASQTVKVLRDHALEASVMKIAGSELLSFVCDRCLKMHGGYGFLEEYHVERFLRDNVVDMIFEGTNDINRIVIFDFLVRRAMSGEIGFREGIERLETDLASAGSEVNVGCISEIEILLKGARLLVANLLNQVLIHLGKAVRTNQMAMVNVADAVIESYIAYAAFLRMNKLQMRDEGNPVLLQAVVRLLAEHARTKIIALTHETFASILPENLRAVRLAEVGTLCAALPPMADLFALRRIIAEEVSDAGKYNL